MIVNFLKLTCALDAVCADDNIALGRSAVREGHGDRFSLLGMCVSRYRHSSVRFVLTTTVLLPSSLMPIRAFLSSLG